MRWFVMSVFVASSLLVFSAVSYLANLKPEEEEFHQTNNHFGFLSRDTERGKEILLRVKSPPPGSEWFLLVEKSDSPIVSVSRHHLRWKGEQFVAEARQDGTATLRPVYPSEREKPLSWCNLDD